MFVYNGTWIKSHRYYEEGKKPDVKTLSRIEADLGTENKIVVALCRGMDWEEVQGTFLISAVATQAYTCISICNLGFVHTTLCKL